MELLREKRNFLACTSYCICRVADVASSPELCLLTQGTHTVAAIESSTDVSRPEGINHPEQLRNCELLKVADIAY